LKQQLEEAKDEIATLIRQSKFRVQHYQKLVEKQKFCITKIEAYEKYALFYTGLSLAEDFINCWIM